MADLDDLKQRLRDFAAARDWEQFHTPKNLAMALVAEAAEVVEHFQWLTAAESQALDAGQRDEVALELADVLLYLVMLADRLGVDLGEAASRKIGLNERRFPPVSRP
jgi:dCTP diphosphatase